MIQFNKQVVELVKQANVNDRVNNILFKDREVAEMFKSLYKLDRFDFVIKTNKIAKELIPFITPFHNKSVIVTDKKGKMLHGVIEHLPTRINDGKTLDNNVSFRTFKDGSIGIALWVNTGNKYSTHLYNSEDITLL